MMFKSVLMARAVVTFAVMALMTTQAQVGGSPRPGPRPPPDIPRLCDTYFYALGKGFPTYTCRNSKGEGYRCARKDCYLKNPNRQLSQLQFHQCKRYTDNGGTVEHVSFQPDEGFQVDRKRHLITGLGTQPGIAGIHYFECPTHDNGDRPWCDHCQKMAK
ncbi:hypothetical protein Pst134EA_004628 [Puccinia striiformis f. sp. tritici]|uniref:uncharacterized protein n=1 Tax=Puccinia striiformis f. sp. tritici TaxID=168172 RepID=UPI002007B182|nr:uncharacterized protein Pst134EA_032545 [Puccinia striiformis f. sp. tritici]XP_047810160.1 hypothetical protein Pst134EA_004628 [Puccinia striiformis f. sp. tritici]KAH9443597.1 hypothetical protein Pst134EA_032545 [Puccinia striiformis f. sp. tritici]KAH9461776.1 hypothetical protein Pst134EB_005697 [Puccinia striiformis f. sp. tritici]KAH9470706.1 hypothetical protein Pst134EA_004628 [Puccinia striiformis f. sp. tritici]